MRTWFPKHAVVCLAIAGGACGKEAARGTDAGVPGTDGGALDAAAGGCGDVPSLKLTPVATGLRAPTFAAGSPGDPSRLFVLERTGRIRVVKDGALAAAPFLDLSAQVSGNGNDDGLLGLAFHPDYAVNGRLFVAYSNKQHDLIVAEYARGASADVAAATATRTFFDLAIPAQVRYGGMLAFGPDGKLYIGVGDGAPDGDPNHDALNLGLERGKILRIDVDQFPTPPAGNLTGAGVDPHIWDYGLREPWRFSFDTMTGELYIGDVGHPSDQEIEIEPAATGGRNYGWSRIAGTHCVAPGCDTTGATMPAVTYPKAIGCAMIGGYVYRGTRNSCLSGWYLYADYCSSTVHVLRASGGVVATDADITSALDPDGQISAPASFGQDDDGELYLVDIAANTVFRIDGR